MREAAEMSQQPAFQHANRSASALSLRSISDDDVCADSFGDQAFAIAFASNSVQRASGRGVSNHIDQGALADIAFAEYEFGEGVMVTDTSGWEYTTPGHERTRMVYVETEREDDGPAPRWVLNFTVRFDPASGALTEAYAMDEKGQIWGAMPTQREVSNYI